MSDAVIFDGHRSTRRRMPEGKINLGKLLEAYAIWGSGKPAVPATQDQILDSCVMVEETLPDLIALATVTVQIITTGKMVSALLREDGTPSNLEKLKAASDSIGILRRQQHEIAEKFEL